MKINVLVFGQLVDITKKTEMQILDIKNTNELTQKLVELFPTIISINYTLALNKKSIRENTLLNDDDTVALLPAFSGG